MHIALYFGSFNPIHTGHIRIAEYLIERQLCDEVWLMVSPQNPFKEQAGLAPEADRLEMARLAIAESRYRANLSASDFEFSLPRPSWTIDTLRALQSRYPSDRFSLLMGEDNAEELHLWKEYKNILSLSQIFVYPRNGSQKGFVNNHLTEQEQRQIDYLVEAPRLPQAATSVRGEIEEGRISADIPPSVAEYIRKRKLYGYQ